MTELEILQQKLSAFLKQHQVLKMQLQRLQKEQTKKDLLVQEQSNTIIELRQQLQQNKITEAATTMNANEQLKQQLDLVINAIDRNLDLLK